MTEREIRTLRDKIGTDPILTDEEIEYIWTVMDKQELTEDPKKKGEYQPVTWQEAIQAWVDGKTVKVLTLFGLGSREVKKSRGSSITEYEITNGVWYVED